MYVMQFPQQFDRQTEVKAYYLGWQDAVGCLQRTFDIRSRKISHPCRLRKGLIRRTRIDIKYLPNNH